MLGALGLVIEHVVIHCTSQWLMLMSFSSHARRQGGSAVALDLTLHGAPLPSQGRLHARPFHGAGAGKPRSTRSSTSLSCTGVRREELTTAIALLCSGWPRRRISHLSRARVGWDAERKEEERMASVSALGWATRRFARCSWPLRLGQQAIAAKARL